MAQDEGKSMLVKLSNTNLEVTDPAQDVRGYRVVGKDGQDLGEVDDLILDRVETKVRFLEVASGDLFGLGSAKALIPVDAIIRISDQEVFINRTRQHVAAAPRYDPDLMVRDVGDQGYVGDIYRHYGFLPYWQPGYVYPAHRVSMDPGGEH